MDRRTDEGRSKSPRDTDLDNLVGDYAKENPWRVRLAFWSKVLGWGGAGLTGIVSVVGFLFPSASNYVGLTQGDITVEVVEEVEITDASGNTVQVEMVEDETIHIEQSGKVDVLEQFHFSGGKAK